MSETGTRSRAGLDGDAAAATAAPPIPGDQWSSRTPIAPDLARGALSCAKRDPPIVLCGGSTAAPASNNAEGQSPALRRDSSSAIGREAENFALPRAELARGAESRPGAAFVGSPACSAALFADARDLSDGRRGSRRSIDFRTKRGEVPRWAGSMFAWFVTPKSCLGADLSATTRACSKRASAADGAEISPRRPLLVSNRSLSPSSRGVFRATISSQGRGASG